ncbi:MAG TPA: carbohydrate-binding family 9-like protein [Terriglobales bacterium]|nr:carbohydrate-binding family 9-like protein [Terriglobales bacterium]
MIGFVKAVSVVLLGLLPAMAADTPTLESTRANEDVRLTLDPASSFWNKARSVFLEKDTSGNLKPDIRTEVRTRWTKDNLYFLFICPYQELHLKPEPNIKEETNKLWNWEVAEAFIGSDFSDIQRYKEFEVSPQSEWVDLDIDLHKPHHEDGWTWNSGFEVLARIDPHKHIWYAAMRIPFSAIDTRPPAPGNTLRINLFRSGGSPQHPYGINWQPTMSKTFHTPEKFGLIKLVEEDK